MTRDSDETDVESTESRDACPSEDDVEISSFEKESEESESTSANSSESGFLLLTKTTRDEEMGSVKLNPPNVTKVLVESFHPARRQQKTERSE